MEKKAQRPGLTKLRGKKDPKVTKALEKYDLGLRSVKDSEYSTTYVVEGSRAQAEAAGKTLGIKNVGKGSGRGNNVWHLNIPKQATSVVEKDPRKKPQDYPSNKSTLRYLTKLEKAKGVLPYSVPRGVNIVNMAEYGLVEVTKNKVTLTPAGKKFLDSKKKKHAHRGDWEKWLKKASLKEQVIKQAKEFSTKEELREYLKDHPNADPKKHRVKNIQRPGDGLLRTEVPKNVVADIKKLWEGNGAGSSSDAVSTLVSQASKGKPVSHRAIKSAIRVVDSKIFSEGDKNKVRDFKKLKKTLKSLAKSDLKRQAREATREFLGR